MSELESLAAELREKQRKQAEQDSKTYRDRFWSEANNSPTRPEIPLK